MSELGGALRELAREAVPTAHDDARELWARGRRRVGRRRVVVVSVGLLLAVVAGWVALAAPSRTVVMPAGDPHPPAVPENIYSPDPRLAGTAQDGPLGRLAVLGGGERDFGDFTFSNAVFGISATTGAYRFLDLPGQVLGTPVALSPDGRRVAYWTSGPTTGTAYDDETPRGTPRHVGGFAIYDTEDGSVARAPFVSEHGLSEQVPFWVDSSTVAFEVWWKTTRTAARKVHTYFWAGSAAPVVTTSDVPDISSLQRSRDGSLLTPVRSGGYDGLVVASGGFVHRPGDRVRFASESPQASFDAVSRSGDLVAVVPADTEKVYRPLDAGRAQSDGTVPALRRVGELQYVEILGWRDARTVLATGSESSASASLFTADLQSGDLREIGKVDPELVASDNQLSVATDLVAEPLVHGRRPPVPPDRAWIGIATLVGAGGILVALLLWRRRRG
ncbi:hypothetical protein ACVW00_002334 [Marmoricola sp. URHA0025 HA25]